MNVIQGLPQLANIHEMVEHLWHAQNNQIHMMVHFCLNTGRDEIVAMACDPDEATQWIKRYCAEKHPIALVLVTEAWAYEAFPGFDMSRAMKDPEWYAEQKKFMKRKEMLMCNIETLHGFRDISWEIIRNGLDVKLGERSQRDYTGYREGRMGMFLPKKPSSDVVN